MDLRSPRKSKVVVVTEFVVVEVTTVLRGVALAVVVVSATVVELGAT